LLNLFLIGWGAWRSVTPCGLRVTFLDVGQGDAIVIESPTGRVLVVDAGALSLDDPERNAGHRVVLPFLRGRGIHRVDVLLLTHPDADHIGGAATLLERLSVGLLMDNGQEYTIPLMQPILKAARKRGVLHHAARRGQKLELGGGVTAEILAPNAPNAPEKANDASIVVRLLYGKTTFLLTGDAEATAEQALLVSGSPLRCDVLKAGHHGSRTSTTPEFLAATRPRIAIISAGRRNIYGHPSRVVLDRLRANQVQIFRTDQQGAITCFSDGAEIRVETALPAPSSEVFPRS
jgi:competence protein ComEC